MFLTGALETDGPISTGDLRVKARTISWIIGPHILPWHLPIPARVNFLILPDV